MQRQMRQNRYYEATNAATNEATNAAASCYMQFKTPPTNLMSTTVSKGTKSDSGLAQYSMG